MGTILDFERIGILLNSFSVISGFCADMLDRNYFGQCIHFGGLYPFCELVHSTAEGYRRCLASDRGGCTSARLCGQDYYVYRCHIGLTEMCFPVVYNGEPCGYIIFGSMLTDEDPEDIRRVVDSHRDWVEKTVRRQQEQLAASPPEPTAREMEELARQGREYLPRRVAYWAARMDVMPTGLQITAARTRWGSCSGKNSLCFSLFLMRYPPEAIEYVVVHELAHIRHKNHSPAFYAEVERYLPDWRQRQTLLKR